MSGYLLDTQPLLRWRGAIGPVGRQARAVISDPNAPLWFSVASVWEICIKRSLGKLELALNTEEFVKTSVAAGIRLLEIRPAHLYEVEKLAWHHRDPFDRLLAAQALQEDLAIVSGDEAFDSYGLRRVW